MGAHVRYRLAGICGEAGPPFAEDFYGGEVAGVVTQIGWLFFRHCAGLVVLDEVKGDSYGGLWSVWVGSFNWRVGGGRIRAIEGAYPVLSWISRVAGAFCRRCGNFGWKSLRGRGLRGMAADYRLKYKGVGLSSSDRID